MHRRASAVSVSRRIGEKDPSREVKRVQCPRSPENRPMRVIPAKAGIYPLPRDVDPRLRGGDEGRDFHVYGWAASPWALG
jgi:hypothetical protein